LRAPEPRVFEVQSPVLAVSEEAFDEPPLLARPQDARPARGFRTGHHEKCASLDPPGADREFKVGMTGAPRQDARQATAVTLRTARQRRRSRRRERSSVRTI